MFIRRKTLNRIRRYLYAFYLTNTGYLPKEQEEDLTLLCIKLNVFGRKEQS